MAKDNKVVKERGMFTLHTKYDDDVDVEVRITFQGELDITKKHRIEEAESNFLHAVREIMNEYANHTAQ